jgi:hypothetical protein
MEANELRIENWVNDGTVERKFEMEDFSDLDLTDVSINDFSPILLNKEWLERAGFTYVKYDSGSDYIDEECYELSHKEFFLSYDAEDFSLGLFSSKKAAKNELAILPEWKSIIHVHQLQNLYFALTGEEIEIKM